jgi:hypothetical protein
LSKNLRAWLSANSLQVWADQLLGSQLNSTRFRRVPSITEDPLCLFLSIAQEESSTKGLSPISKGVSCGSALTLLWCSIGSRQQCLVRLGECPPIRNSSGFRQRPEVSIRSSLCRRTVLYFYSRVSQPFPYFLVKNCPYLECTHN